MGSRYQKKTRPEKGKAASTLFNGTLLLGALSYHVRGLTLLQGCIMLRESPVPVRKDTLK